MSAFCCLKSNPQVDNGASSQNKKNRTSIKKDRDEMDLFLLQKQMARDSDLGNGLGALSLGLSMSREEQTSKRDRSTYY